MSLSLQDISSQLELAMAALRLKKHDEVEAMLRPLLQAHPELHAARFYLGTSLLQQEARKEEGAEVLMPLLELEEVPASVLTNVGLYHYVADRFTEAEALFRRALLIEPDNADLHHKLACACLGQRRNPEAIYHFQQALIRKPSILESYPLLVGVLRSTGRFLEAYIWGDRWRRADGSARKADAEQGIALGTARFYEAAAAHMANLPEDDATLQFYPACLAQYMRDFPSSVAKYRHVLKLDNKIDGAHFNLSLLLLAQGELEEGWREFDHRFAKGCAVGPHGQMEPEWDGRPLNGQGILVHSEQGVGDVIQYMRFFPLIQQRGGRVIFSSYNDILALMKAGEGAELVQDVESLDLSYQWQIPLLSLGKIFANRVEDIPANVPYLFAEPQRAAAWRDKLSRDNGIKAGIVWAGNPDHGNDHNRSMMLAEWAPLAAVSGVSFYAIQKGPTVGQAECPPPYLPLLSLSDDISDFNDTAAIIEALDIVICVDTSVAHLAGALGKPVWLLLPDTADWRWIVGRDDSPWYPSMRIFRRTSSETWTEVMVRVAAALDAWCDTRQAGFNPALQAERQAFVAAAAGNWAGAEAAFAVAAQQGGFVDRLALQMARLGAQMDTPPQAWPASDRAPFLQAQLAASRLPASQLTAFWQEQQAQVPGRDTDFALLEQLHAVGEFTEAIELARRMLARAPGDWAARYLLAQCLRKTGHDELAVEEYAAVLKISPRHPEAGINRAMASNRLGKMSDALRQLQYTAMCHPYHPKVRLYLAILLFQQRQFELALTVIAAHRQRWSTDNVSGYWHGAILRQLGRYAEAVEVLSMTIPGGELDAFELQRELGNSRIALHWEAGPAQMKQLHDLAGPRREAQVEYEYGLYLLTDQRYGEGWQACEAKRRVQGSDTFTQRFSSALPLWQGEPLNGRTLLVYCEQGFGDSIQFLRYLFQFEGRCILVHQGGLAELFGACVQRPDTMLISQEAYREHPVAADCHIDLMSLPHALNTQDRLLGELVPYLRDVSGTNPFAELFTSELRPKIGLAWAGNPKHWGDHWRSIDLLKLAPLFKVESVAWYSLQKGVASNDVLLLPPDTPILNAASLSDHFYETLQVIEQLDLVITVDTAVAHLAGAMGKPVWLLLPEQADWRWGRSGERSAWYPNMRLFRQTVQGEWGEVVDRVVSALLSYEAGHA
ncbi:tetratricopeptide repeat protein [Chitinimonas naiadis]